MDASFVPVAALTGLVIMHHELFDIMGVGAIRVTFGAKSPGPPISSPPALLRRALRAHGNQSEQLVLFFPALWIHALFCSAQTAFWYGSLWFCFRVLYSFSYRTTANEEPELRYYTFPCYFLMAFLSLSPVARAIADQIPGYHYASLSTPAFVTLQLSIHAAILAAAISYHRWLRSHVPKDQRKTE